MPQVFLIRTMHISGSALNIYLKDVSVPHYRKGQVYNDPSHYMERPNFLTE